ncbi:cysteine-rich with EGF-like domain protein 2 isoform X2 [Tubulanus polymorphus]|uniref:cysteine-rich with EGF-like domain protein 2 isoform X2 n=1 Tax=Tubulanus polymorphus TaxID=672921 RepID=UPI003DA4DA4F
MNYQTLPALLLLLFVCTGFSEDAVIKKCEVCKELVKNFKAGLQRTSKSNFGGGNTDWEENRLGSFATSETRLIEITENICSGTTDEKKCHHMMENEEEKIEDWWRREFSKKKDAVDNFEKWLCQDELKYCCPDNHFGPDCGPCIGGVARLCNDNGKCDGGGTRSGSGKCKCDSGYKGDMCNECKDGYYEESKNDTHISCKVCHLSCKNTCSTDGPKGCDDCRDGYVKSEAEGCSDIDECKLQNPCKPNQYCSNTVGSYVCMSCDKACETCLGSGAESCVKCKVGYTMENNTCVDVDECKLGTYTCTMEHTVCSNKPGSYTCKCESGYEFIGDKCVSRDLNETEEKNNTKKERKAENFEEENKTMKEEL